MTSTSLEACLRCKDCDLSQTRQSVVISRGNPAAELMLIGEAPGAQEDVQGLPFVGRSGRMLDQLLREVGLDPERETYVCNVIKCRPPNNRRPKKAELKACRRWFDLQLTLVNPRILVLIGATAVEAVLGGKDKMTELRGTWQRWQDRDVMPIFHPSYLLRNPSRDEGAPIALTRADLTAVRQRLCER
ncbi:MAG: uracil-DNA glycosylase [Synechococcus sp.]|nr:uracil-DNA glycosylase [Synechococcus sp.]